MLVWACLIILELDLKTRGGRTGIFQIGGQSEGQHPGDMNRVWACYGHVWGNLQTTLTRVKALSLLK